MKQRWQDRESRSYLFNYYTHWARVQERTGRIAGAQEMRDARWKYSPNGPTERPTGRK